MNIAIDIDTPAPTKNSPEEEHSIIVVHDIPKECYALSGFSTSVRDIVNCWASTGSFIQTDSPGQPGTLELISPNRLYDIMIECSGTPSQFFESEYNYRYRVSRYTHSLSYSENKKPSIEEDMLFSKKDFEINGNTVVFGILSLDYYFETMRTRLSHLEDQQECEETNKMSPLKRAYSTLGQAIIYLRSYYTDRYSFITVVRSDVSLRAGMYIGINLTPEERKRLENASVFIKLSGQDNFRDFMIKEKIMKLEKI